MSKIKISNSIVVMSGDEMAQIMWQMIRTDLIEPYIDCPWIDFDLSIQNREATKDKVTTEAALATKQHRVSIKCATITPDQNRVKEFNLSTMWKSPNGTIRNILGGTVFREPILCNAVQPLIANLKQPIIIGRHAFGDQYAATEFAVPGPGSLTLQFNPADGSAPVSREIRKFEDKGIAMAMFNLDASIKEFARSCFSYALMRNYPLYFASKNTILKVYDGRFKDLFQEVFLSEYKQLFEQAGLTYEHRLIDDMVAWALGTSGGFLWACKNYDGDVQSDSLARIYGSLGMMKSVLISPDGTVVESEAAHGTVTRHFRQRQQGQKTSTNPVASIFAWTGGLRFRGQFDKDSTIIGFADRLERVCLDAIESGTMTKDLLATVPAHIAKSATAVTTEEFLTEVKRRLDS